jgi:hypothetical protein
MRKEGEKIQTVENLRGYDAVNRCYPCRLEGVISTD